MAKCETDLAIVVGSSGSYGASRRGRRQNRGDAPRRERKRMVVPGEQDRLEQDCKNAEKCRAASRRRHFRLARSHRCR
jgi:hypothetical protein